MSLSISPLLLTSFLVGAGCANTLNKSTASAATLLLSTVAIEPVSFRLPGVFQLAALHAPDTLAASTSHVDLFLLGAAVLAAGAGAVAYVLRKNRKKEDELPKDGVHRTESQKAALREALRLEKILTLPDGKARREALPLLLDLVRKLAPGDRPARMKRIANQLCLDWPWINKDPTLGNQIKNRLPRLQAPLLKQLTDALETLRKDRQVANLSAYAEAILKWIKGE
ncbi:MAG TPA: hypothetical protein VFX30_03315 [bacterium]|nr:hypothetical protein [bacterium]